MYAKSFLSCYHSDMTFDFESLLFLPSYKFLVYKKDQPEFAKRFHNDVTSTTNVSFKSRKCLFSSTLYIGGTL